MARKSMRTKSGRKCSNESHTTCKWKRLVHKGPVFADSYKPLPKSVKFRYARKCLHLNNSAEEPAGFFAKLLDDAIIKKPIFKKNFFNDWREVMTDKDRRKITDLNKCDFSELHQYYKKQAEQRKKMTAKEKMAVKRKEERLKNTYGICIVDNRPQKIGNFKMEPPGIFRGRGNHPKMGKLKRRVLPKDVIINIGKNVHIPKPRGGGKWKAVIHDNTLSWLASWMDSITGSMKYMRLSQGSTLSEKSDMQKYEKAREIASHLDYIRHRYLRDLKSKESSVRQKAVALYFIDELALRIGNEKKADATDTVGCCSLRIEHLTLRTEKSSKKTKHFIELDFPGKDTVQYKNLVEVPKDIYLNLEDFVQNKNKKDELFDEITTSDLNKYLNDMMEGLTAKVFRTLHASQLFELKLDCLTKSTMSDDEKIFTYNQANRDVAILCNHYRAMPKGFQKSIKNTRVKIDMKLKLVRRLSQDIRDEQATVDEDDNAGKNKFEKAVLRFKKNENQLKKLLLQAIEKVENKDVALGTSKLNYIDPRISVAWCKRWNVPVENIFNRTQMEKFHWAMNTSPNFRF